jgi:bla regulator protein blaR1
MPILLGPELALWCELLAVLGLGTSVAVALAAFISGRVRSAVWERAVWQACTLTLLALVCLELTGVGAAAVRLCVASWREVRSDREILEPAFTQILEDGSGLDIQSQLTAGDSTLVAPAHTWWPAVVWGVGSFVILGRMVWSRALLAVFWWRCEPLGDAAIQSRIQSIANRLGIRRVIRTLTSNSLRSPAVFHWVFPVLALPSRFSDDFSDAQQEAVLAHELAHLARRDPIWQSVAMLTCAVLWWQPLSWWSSRRLRASSEAAADEASLLLADGPRQLAGSLVSLAQRLTDPHVATGTGVQGNGLQSDLARRVERLLSLEAGVPKAPSKPKLAFAHTALPVCFSMLCIFCTAWAPSRRSFTQGETTVNVLSSSWRSSLAATVMWTALGGGSRLPADETLHDETVQATTENARSARRDTLGDTDRVREVLEAIRQQVEQLKKEGKREAAERLMQVAETMTRKFAERAEPQSGDRAESVERKLRAVREQAAKLSKEGKGQEAEKLMKEAESMARAYKDELGRRDVDRSESVQQRRSELVKQKLRATREQVERLRKSGEHGAAEKLMRDAEAMARENQARAARSELADVARQKLRATREKVEQLRKQGDNEAAEKLMRDAEATARQAQEQAQKADREELVKQKLREIREQVDQLRKQGNNEAAEKLEDRAERVIGELIRRQANNEFAQERMRDAEAIAGDLEERPEPTRGDSADDLRAGLRQVQRDLKELREQFRRLLEQRGADRN